ncbi:MAG: hypothetical protein OHK0054_12070 [Sideroxydans sp.]
MNLGRFVARRPDRQPTGREASLASLRSRYMMASLLGAIGWLLGMIGLAQAAEVLTDPTRPAFELVPGLAATTAPGAESKEDAPPAGLQSVFLARGHEAAIIGGTEVALGQKYGDAVLTVVNETCVVLVGPQGRQVLHMFPTVQMSKSQRDCVKRPVLNTISRSAAVPSAGARGVSGAGPMKRTKKARKARRAVVCTPEPGVDGSRK